MSGTGITDRSRAVLRKAGLALFVFAAMLAVAEAVLRRQRNDCPTILFESLGEHMGQVQLDAFTHVVVNDPLLFWRLGAHQTLPDDATHIRGLVSNGTGLREDHEIPLRKPAGELRILCVGDSCTFGFGLRHGETYVELAERLLRARHPERRVECINAGVPGYTLAQGWQQFLRDGVRYKPDLVLVAFGWNDSRAWTSHTDWQQMEAARRGPPGVLARSELCWRLWRRLHQEEDAAWRKGRRVTRVPAPEYEEILRRMAEAARERGAELMPVVWPVLANFTRWTGEGALPLTEYQRLAQQVGSEAACAGCVDLIPAMVRALQEHPLDALFQDGVHTQPLANGYIAEEIADAVDGWLARVPQKRGEG